MDRYLRELERQAALGDPQARAKLKAERIRQGIITDWYRRCTVCENWRSHPQAVFSIEGIPAEVAPIGSIEVEGYWVEFCIEEIERLGGWGNIDPDSDSGRQLQALAQSLVEGHNRILPGSSWTPGLSMRRNPSVRAKTVLAWREDIGKKRIRIPKIVRDVLGVNLGDKVEASGPSGSLQLTAVFADLSEIGKQVAGIDKESRKKLGAELGEFITLSRPPRRRHLAQQEFWLFNYGSNHPEQLEERLGHPVEGVTAAYLPNYELCFLGYSYNWEGGVAGLKEKRGAEACGYVAKVNKDDLVILDGFEGVAGGYYYREAVSVMKARNNGFKKVDAIVYLPGPKRLDADEHHYPSDDYLDAVKKTIFTFWDHDECQDYLDEALEEVF